MILSPPEQRLVLSWFIDAPDPAPQHRPAFESLGAKLDALQRGRAISEAATRGYRARPCR